MKVTVINRENLPAFSAMLHDEEKRRIAAGLPVIALGAADDESAIGVLTGRITDEDTFYITNIFVKQEARRAGAGSMLIDSLLEVLPGGIPVEAELFAEKSDDAKDSLVAFFASMGFISYIPDDTLYSITLWDAISALDPLIKKVKAAKTLAQYSPSEIKTAGMEAIRMGLPIPADGFPSKGIDEELSSMVYEDGKLKGYLLVDRFQDQHLTISGLYADNDPKRIIELFAASLPHAMTHFGEEEPILLPVISSKGEKLVNKLFPKAKRLSICYCLYR